MSIPNPNLPAQNAPISSSELRAQFAAIAERFDLHAAPGPLDVIVSEPPTRAEVQAIADKLEVVLAVLRGE